MGYSFRRYCSGNGSSVVTKISDDERERKAYTPASAATATMTVAEQAPWDAWAAAHITRALAERDEYWREVHACVLATERENVRAELAKLRGEIDALRAQLKQLGGGEPIDLPVLELRGRMQ